MNGSDFVLVVDLAVSAMQQMFAMMDSVNIVGTSPRLSVYGLAVFSVFAVMTADFIAALRSGN